MPDSFDADKQRALELLQAARAQSEAMTQFAVNAWRKPSSELFALYDRILSEPPPPVEQWPARAATAGIVYTYNALEYQYASMRALLKALEAAFPKDSDTIEIDRESEAGGPVVLKPLVPVGNAKVVKPSLVCPGCGVIPSRCVDIELDDQGRIKFRLVGLGNRGQQPLGLGLYTGMLHRRDGHELALLKVRVVPNVP